MATCASSRTAMCSPTLACRLSCASSSTPSISPGSRRHWRWCSGGRRRTLRPQAPFPPPFARCHDLATVSPLVPPPAPQPCQETGAGFGEAFAEAAALEAAVSKKSDSVTPKGGKRPIDAVEVDGDGDGDGDDDDATMAMETKMTKTTAMSTMSSTSPLRLSRKCRNQPSKRVSPREEGPRKTTSKMLAPRFRPSC